MIVTKSITQNLNFIAVGGYEIYANLTKRPDPVPAEYTEDSNTLILAAQFTNASAYQGYRLTTNLGVNWQRQDYKTGTGTNLMASANIYAGMGDL